MEENYYNKKYTGGAVNASGLNFQDCVSIIYLFRYIDNNDFKEITYEMIDDFTIIFDSYELCVQVKSNNFGINDVKDLVNKRIYNDKKRYMYVCSGYDNRFRNLIGHVNSYNNVTSSYRTDEEKNDIENNFKNLVERNGIDYYKFLRSNFEECPFSKVKELAKLEIYMWADRNNLEIDVNDLFKIIIANMASDLRVNRGFLKNKDIKNLALRCKKKLNIIEETNLDISTDIEYILKKMDNDLCKSSCFIDKLKLLKVYIENKDYLSALKISEEIDRDTDKYKIYSIWCNYNIGNYKKVEGLCNSILEKDEYNYLANIYMGIINIKFREKAIKHLSKAREMKDSYEVNYNMATVYKISEESAKSLLYYKRCLEIDNNSVDAHFNISMLLPYSESIEHLDKVIQLDKNFQEAYLSKGKILRFFGKYEDAYEYLDKYIQFGNENNDEVIKEIALCLLDMGRQEESNCFLGMWLKELLTGEEFRNMKNDRSIVILDLLWHDSKFLACTKQGDSFIVETPFSSFMLSMDNESEIGIGIVVDTLLDFFKRSGESNGKKFPKGYEYIPVIIKTYKGKEEYLRMKESILNENILSLNKDYSNDLSICREYEDNSNTIEIVIEECDKYIVTTIKVGNNRIGGWFPRTGENYFKFKCKVDEEIPFDRAAILLACIETNETMRIIMNVNNIKFNKNPLYKREKYYNDIKMPLI